MSLAVPFVQKNLIIPLMSIVVPFEDKEYLVYLLISSSDFKLLASLIFKWDIS